MGKEVGQSWIWRSLGKCIEGRGSVLKQCVEPGSYASTIYLWFYSASVRMGFRQHQPVTKRPPLPVKIMLSSLTLIIVWLMSLKTVLKGLCCHVPSYGGVGHLLLCSDCLPLFGIYCTGKNNELESFPLFFRSCVWQRTSWCLLGLMIQKQECGGLLSWSIGVVEMWAPCLLVNLRLGRMVTNLRRGWRRKVWVCCYLSKHPDSWSDSENTSETEEISQGAISWVGQKAVALTMRGMGWEHDTDVMHLHLDLPWSKGEGEEGRQAGLPACEFVPPHSRGCPRGGRKQCRAGDGDETWLSHLGSVEAQSRADRAVSPHSSKNIPMAFSTMTFKHFHRLIQLEYRKHLGWGRAQCKCAVNHTVVMLSAALPGSSVLCVWVLGR